MNHLWLTLFLFILSIFLYFLTKSNKTRIKYMYGERRPENSFSGVPFETNPSTVFEDMFKRGPPRQKSL